MRVPLPDRLRAFLNRPADGVADRNLYLGITLIAVVVPLLLQAGTGGLTPAPLVLSLLMGGTVGLLMPRLPAAGTTLALVTWVTAVLVLGPGVESLLPLALTLALVLGRYLPAREAVPVFLLVVATIGLGTTVTSFDLWRYLVGSAFILLVGGPPALLLGQLRRRSELAHVAEARAARERTEALRLEVAREMHDLVAYSMSQTALRAQRASLDPAYPEAARAEFAALEATASDALHELRLIVRSLRAVPGPHGDPASATGLGGVTTDLPYALRAVADDVEAAGFTVLLRTVGEGDPTRAQASALSRVAREMGANVVRHGDPTGPVTLTLTLGGDAIRLVSTNRAAPHQGSLPSSGAGVVGMRERLAAVGGTLTALQEEGSWIVSATIPVAGAGSASCAPSTTPTQEES